jgi:D-amino-acid oxidase
MPDVVVVGAGFLGLSTAVRLLESGRSVAVWTADDPLATTSAVAAAIWYPFLAEPRHRVLGWSAATFRRLAALAGDPASGVRMIEAVQVFAAEPDVWWANAVDELRRLPAREVPAGFHAAIAVRVPLGDTSRYLPWLVGQVQQRGGSIERRRLLQLDEATAAAPAVVNCTGLGARELCGDRSLHAVRGQMLTVSKCDVPRALIDDTGARPLYVLPREHDIVLGGTVQDGNEDLTADAATSAAIQRDCVARMPQLAGATVRAVKVGLRPCRPEIRLERQACADGRRLVHCYGHGGSGFTLSWGCADEVIALLG